MKTKIGLLMVTFFIAITNLNAQGLTNTKTEPELLGLPGDSLNLYAVLDLFQKSPTIEKFEASLNDKKTGINNLDLDLDKKVDFIKVVTQKENDDFAFVLQVNITNNEVQDVAVILVTKDEDKKVSIQMVGDADLYGKDYVIEPKAEISAITANPAYTGTVGVQSQPATTVVIESEPIVQYVYSPVYVPYYPPYYYGYYPVYYTPYPIISINIYFGRHYHHHNHYYGGHRGGNTIIIKNNTYNNYGKTRNTSNVVNNHKNKGDYKKNNTLKQSPKNNGYVINQNPSYNFKNKPNTIGQINKGNIQQKTPYTPINKPNIRPTAPRSKPNMRPPAPRK